MFHILLERKWMSGGMEMIYRRETYRIQPEMLEDFNEFFHQYRLPNQLKHGAKLIGRWTTEARDEVVEIWEYPNEHEYIKIEERVKKDRLYEKARMHQQKKGSLYVDKRQDFLQSTGTYECPKHTVTVSGYITNEKQETLLVKTDWRSDTWELPGGAVDEGETLDSAVCREIFEETGIHVRLIGVTGIYSNGNTIAVVFRGEYSGGILTSSSETKDVCFCSIHSSNISQYITRSKFRNRILDAMNGCYAPYEAFRVRPFELLNRLEGN
jgi:ADP-ribose pyrophosphatase YjhB (NUDIX family)